jgi:hypothetical protein
MTPNERATRAVETPGWLIKGLAESQVVISGPKLTALIEKEIREAS